MSFNGTEGGTISLQTGAQMTASYRTRLPGQIKGRFFGKDILNDILAQSGCMGIRAYFAMNSADEMELVICGADANENDMLEIIADVAVPCPNRCGTKNSLNGC